MSLNGFLLKKINLNLHDFLSWIIIMLVFTSTPFITTSLYLGPRFYYPVIIFLLLLLGSLSLLHNKAKIEKGSSTFFYSWVFVLFVFVIYAVAHILYNHSLDEFRLVIGFVVKLLFIFIASYYISHKPNLFIKKLFLISAIMCTGAALTSILLMSGLWPFGHSIIHFDNGRISYNFYLSNTNSLWNFGSYAIPRIAGFLTEPGSFGLYLTYLLAINEVTLQSKFYRYLFILTGLLTWSLGFIISLFFFIIYWLLGVGKVNKLFLTIILVGLGFGINYLYKSGLSEKDPMVRRVTKTFNRLKYNEKAGTIKGDNRFANSEIITHPYIGAGPDVGNDSIYGYMYNYGIPTAILSYTPLFFLFIAFIKYGSWKELILFLIIAINFLQRPVIAVLYIIVPLIILYASLSNRPQRNYISS